MSARFWRSLTAVGLAVVAAATGAVATAAPAGAAAYGGQCGAGYEWIQSRFLDGGTVYLTYNASNGYNCVVTIRDDPGSAVYMNAFVKRSTEDAWVRDPGNYTTYAGPVYTYARSQCVDWGGTIYGVSNQVVVTRSACG
ncbi:spore-associated protein A [Marinactinospora rubrisoli]|uniref:Spore-associated protein A n=1 Tax=Marinactinospora rubrisoli TaxID=2715399 RepID=A0ABW2KI71_9ACTN